MGAIVSSKDKQATIKDLLEKAKPSLAAVLPKHVTPDRLLKVAMSATARTPALLACDPKSILLAVMQSAELGLEIGGLLGDAYFVPFKTEAKLVIGYRGMVKLARQSGELSSLEAHTVHANDTFEIEFGLDTKLVHRPYMTGDRGEVVAAYAIARFKDGGHQIDVMTRFEIDQIRSRSASAGAGPWVTDYAEMAKKTVVRRLCKYLPLSPELSKALEHEAASEQNVASPIIDVEIFPADAPPAERDRGAELKGALAEKKNGSDKAPESSPKQTVTADGEVLPA